MKYLIASVFCCSIWFGAIAQRPVQKDFTIVAGVDMAYATGKFNFAHRLGYGISVQGEYLFADNSSVTINSGYMYFVSKKKFTDTIPADIVTAQLNDFSAVPFLLGVKIDNEGRFYLHPQVGLIFRSNPFISSSYALAAGVVVSKNTDFSFRFQVVQKKGVAASFFALRAAYIF